MKKVLSIVMVLMIVACLMIPVFASAEKVTGKTAMYVYCKNGKKLNVREAATRDSQLLFRLRNGNKVSILEDAGNGWAKISYDGKEGFVSTSFLRSKMPARATKKISTFRPFSAKVYSPNGKKCNMRVNASVKADRITKLKGHTSIKVIGRAGNWYKIQYGNATGYMMKKYVRS